MAKFTFAAKTFASKTFASETYNGVGSAVIVPPGSPPVPQPSQGPGTYRGGPGGSMHSMGRDWWAEEKEEERQRELALVLAAMNEEEAILIASL